MGQRQPDAPGTHEDDPLHGSAGAQGSANSTSGSWRSRPRRGSGTLAVT
jgi:hypothetical protein